MSNLIAQWKAENTDKYLDEGIHENCVIARVDREPRKKQDGSVMKVAMFIKYFQVDDTGKPLGTIEEFIFWPKHDGKTTPLDSFMRLVTRLSAILQAFGYPENDINNYLDITETLGINTNEELNKYASNAKNMKTLTEATNKAFADVCEQLSGATSPYKFRLKVAYQETGRGVEVATGSAFIESMGVPKEQSVLKFTDKDIRARMEAQKPKAATNLAVMPVVPGGVPGGSAVPGMPPVNVAAPVQSVAPVIPATNVVVNNSPVNPVERAILNNASGTPPNLPFIKQN